MPTKLKLPAFVWASLCGFLAFAHSARSQGTTFTYQGQLQNSGSPVNGFYDFRFRLDADPEGNTVLATELTNAIGVTNGLFTTTINFGPGWFNGSNYWLEVDVRTNNPANTLSYTALSPFQPLTPTPYAVFANSASNLSGTLTSANLSGNYGSAVSLTNGANVLAGNGAGVTNVNAGTLNGLNAGAFWQLGGNNVSAGQFLGSTNNQPVEIWADGMRALRLEPNATAPNVIGGAINNSVSAGVAGAVIGGGGNSNSITGQFGTIGGGSLNAADNYGFVGGGQINGIQGVNFNSTIAGGYNNTIGPNANNSVIAGGFVNTIQTLSPDSFIGGGFANLITGNYQQTGSGLPVANTIAGGYGNQIQTNDAFATIGGGQGNVISNCFYAVIPGGYKNTAVGEFSFAAGQQAQAAHQGAFVWADSQNLTYSSTTADSFNIRAQGGVHLDNSTSMAFGDQTRQMLELYRDPTSTYIYGIGVQNGTFYQRTGTNGDFAWYMGGSHNDNQNNPGGGVTLMTLSKSAGLTVNGTFVSASDRNLKENFRAVSGREVLQKVAALPVSRWNYKEDAGTAHIGPMAQDFYAAFGVGPDDKHITTVDEGGVAFAAIQGLNQKLEEDGKAKDAEIKELKESVDELRKLVLSLSRKN